MTAVNSDRLLRALERGGLARRTGDQWSVYRGRDLRRTPVGTLRSVEIDALMAEGRLCWFGDGRDAVVWAAADDTGVEARDVKRPCIAAKRTQRRSPLAQVLDCAKDDRDRARWRDALIRLDRDVERAATSQAATMRWDGAGHVDGSRASGRAGLALGAVEAAKRLAALRGVLGPLKFRVVVDLAIHQRPIRRIARDAEWSERSAIAQVSNAVDDLAIAYDNAVRRNR